MDRTLRERIDDLEPARLRAIVGPMYSGKTLSGLQRLEKIEYGIKSVLSGALRDPSEFTIVFKPSKDDRNDDYVFTHESGNQCKGIVIPWDRPERMLDDAYQERRIILYDEVQFSAPHAADVFDELRRQGRYVIASGLDLDFLGEPFETTSRVMAYADSVEKLTAHCMYDGCGRAASRSQLLRDSTPVTSADTNVIIQSDTEEYEARCLEHYVSE